jgi:predicted ATPase
MCRCTLCARRPNRATGGGCHEANGGVNTGCIGEGVLGGVGGEGGPIGKFSVKNRKIFLNQKAVSFMPDIKIKSIAIKNFKSFDDLQIDLDNLNIIIGTNASGKSNFINIFKFLRDIIREGLENAISIQGGKEYLLNSKIGYKDELNLKIEVLSDIIIPLPERKFKLKKKIKKPNLSPKDQKKAYLHINSSLYEFSLKFFKDKDDYIITKDEFFSKGTFLLASSFNFKTEELEDKEILGNVNFSFYYEKGKVKSKIESEIDEFYRKALIDLYQFSDLQRKIEPKRLIIEKSWFFPSTFLFTSIFLHMSIFDIDPKLSKKGIPITGKKNLEEDGSNLAIVIKNILQNPDKERDFFNIVNNILPFVEEFKIEKIAGKNLIFNVKEIYYEDYWPATFISDGTINIISIIIALYFENLNVVIFEEPERNIHPMLISTIIDIFQETSEKRQIIITTHNPDFVKKANLNDIIFISRNENGYSKLVKPKEIEKVKKFLTTEMGLDELFRRDLIGE